MSLTEAELWKIVDNAQWTKDYNYDRIKQEFNLLPRLDRNQLEKFINGKESALYKRFEGDWLGRDPNVPVDTGMCCNKKRPDDPGFPVSDDSYGDLIAEVVGRGEAFYNSITTEKLRKMAIEGDFRENFTYSVSFDHDDNEESATKK